MEKSVSLIKHNRRYALVIGGFGEIGERLCIELEKKKIIPIVCYNSYNKINSQYKKFKVDLTNTNEIDFFLKNLKKNYENIEYIFHLAAGGLDLKKVTRFHKKKLLNDFNIAVTEPLRIFSFVILNYFIKVKRGNIYAILSKAMGTHNMEPMQLMGSYLISKNALKMTLDIIKTEFKWLNVNYLHLGFVKTKFIDVFDERFLHIVSKKEKILKPQEAAKLIIKSINYDN